MSFTSGTFIFFLWVVFAAYWFCPSRKGQNLLVVIASYVFYGWWNWSFCLLIFACSTLNYLGALALSRAATDGRRRAWVIGVAAVNLAILGYYKYAGFFLDNLRAIAGLFHISFTPPELQIILPLAISFHTFQALGYVLEVYRGQLPVCRSFLDFLAFSTFFPQLVAGPIERARELLPQFGSRRAYSYERLSDGCRQILWGFFKKMVIADNLSLYVQDPFSKPEQYKGYVLCLAILFFAFQIYCDFSAYSDIAIGAAKLFGINLSRNFIYPYFSMSPREFWRRWHVSLSRWFRDHVYIPLGGNLTGRARQVGAVMATFLLSGLWHGASWNFVIWGGLNGFAVLPSFYRSRSSRSGEPINRQHVPMVMGLAQLMATFLFINLTWVFFRAASLSSAEYILGRVFLSPRSFLSGGLPLAGPFPTVLALAAIAVLLVIEWRQRAVEHPLVFRGASGPWRWAAYTALFWLILLAGDVNKTAFIYFQF